jgi:hypothetical protein
VGANQTLFASVYSVDPSSAALSDRSLLDLGGFCELSLTGLGTTVPVATFSTARCNPLDVLTGAPLGAIPTGHYFISIRIAPGAVGNSTTFASSDVPSFAVSSMKNYSYNAALSAPGKMINPSPLAVTTGELVPVESWYANGFGATIVPSIGVDLAGNFGSVDAIFGNGFE